MRTPGISSAATHDLLCRRNLCLPAAISRESSSQAGYQHIIRAASLLIILLLLLLLPPLSWCYCMSQDTSNAPQQLGSPRVEWLARVSAAVKLLKASMQSHSHPATPQTSLLSSASHTVTPVTPATRPQPHVTSQLCLATPTPACSSAHSHAPFPIQHLRPNTFPCPPSLPKTLGALVVCANLGFEHLF